MVHGIWLMGHGTWYMGHVVVCLKGEILVMVYGTWDIKVTVGDLWYMVHWIWDMVHQGHRR
jgi:hypothetical protein